MMKETDEGCQVYVQILPSAVEITETNTLSFQHVLLTWTALPKVQAWLLFISTTIVGTKY